MLLFSQYRYFLAIEMPLFLRQYAWLAVILFCVALAIGLIIGYLVGNNSLKKDYNMRLDELSHNGTVQKSINNNVGLGIIVYNDERPIYYNKTIRKLPGFLTGDGIPQNIQVFLDMYDKGNHLKSDYLLSIENGLGMIRKNYVVDNRIYEIKILRKEPDYDDELYEDQKEQTPHESSEILNFVIVEDITQIKDDERRQRDLAANVSHELNTPLTVIRASENFIQKLSPNNMPSYQELSRWGNRILANAIRMQDIVEDFLVLSMSAQTKRMSLFDLDSVVNKAIANLNDYPNADKVTIVPPSNETSPLCFGNDRLIMRVVTNLLTNAVKYISYDGKTAPNEIKINIVTIPDKIGIEVTDNGRGIPEKDIGHLFERFYRVDNSGSRDVGGSGLGLAIAKEITDLHDGNIEVVSRLNEGSVFTLFLPTAKATFDRILEDSHSGVLADMPYIRAAAVFFARELIEASKSKGYLDVTEFVEHSNLTEPLDKAADIEIVKLINLYGDERFKDLVDELTYVEVFDDEDDYEAAEDEDLNDEPEVEPETYEIDDQEAVCYSEEVLEAFEESREAIRKEEESEQLMREMEEQERQKKKEMQEFLMQPVVQQSVKQTEKTVEKPQKTPEVRAPKISKEDFVKLEDKDKTLIHPNTDKKMYNIGTKLFEGKNKINKNLTGKGKVETKEESEPIRSAVRLVLDEATVMDNKIKNTENEGNR